jgi:thiosulfate/3-mercaptopyruvate sulfurtransferase
MRVPTPIITATALRRLLESGEAIVLLDARPKRDAWAAGHLPGSIFADVNEDLSDVAQPTHDDARGGRHPLPTLEQWRRTLGRWGITPSTDVVVYDDQSGANAATRVWWMLRAIGHDRVAVLDGGLPETIASGIALATDVPVVAPAPPYPATGWQRTITDIETIDNLRRDPAWRIVDARSAPRYAGLEEPLDPIAGHIPGVVNLFFGENLTGGRYKSPEALRRMYDELLGGVQSDRVIVHCGSGVTACHTLLALELAGIDGAQLYVGGWSEWCRSGRPRAPGQG